MSYDEDDVGYKKPPVATRFTKGKSGNPAGRPKNSAKKQNFKGILDEILAETIIIDDNGKSAKITKGKAWLKLLMHSALKGDKKAIDILAHIYLPIKRSADQMERESLPRPIVNVTFTDEVRGEKITMPMKEYHKMRAEKELSEKSSEHKKDGD